MTNTPKHTPGPWTWAAYGGRDIPAYFSILTVNTVQALGSEKEQRVHIADIHTTPSDAALIAAAPAMYKALSMAREAIERLQRPALWDAHGTVDVIKAALAQVEGGGK